MPRISALCFRSHMCLWEIYGTGERICIHVCTCVRAIVFTMSDYGIVMLFCRVLAQEIRAPMMLDYENLLQ